MIRYSLTKEEAVCCGCRACEQSCPKQAIAMQPNAEGFLYPVVDAQRCIQCGLCDRVCPMEHRPAGGELIGAYAVQHLDGSILQASSSGGAFRLLADRILEEGGCVVGCVWDENNHPVLAIAQDTAGLAAMQGSKYLFSDTRDMYSRVRMLLETGRKVLFTGAPCQCAGLLNYLGRDYEQLLTADFLCHGMPSWQAFDAYLDDLQHRTGGKPYDIQFRDKARRGWGMAFSCRYQKAGKEKKLTNQGWTDAYLYGFIRGYFNRYSCYTCPFRGAPRFTDFTFCDYWGIEKNHPEILAENGVSAVTLHSPKARAYQRLLQDRALWVETSPAGIAQDNPSLLEPTEEKIPPLRAEIYSKIRHAGWSDTAEQWLRAPHRGLKKLWYSLPRGVARKIRRFLH